MFDNISAMVSFQDAGGPYMKINFIIKVYQVKMNASLLKDYRAHCCLN